MHLTTKALGAAALLFALSGCSFAPVVAQKMGIGTASEEDIQQATAKVFGVPLKPLSFWTSAILTPVAGTQIFYAATVQGKAYRCGMLSSFAGASLPKCVKPGEPLSLQ